MNLLAFELAPVVLLAFGSFELAAQIAVVGRTGSGWDLEFGFGASGTCDSRVEHTHIAGCGAVV